MIFQILKCSAPGATLSTFVSLLMAGGVLLVMTQDLRVSIIATITIVVIVYAETGVLGALSWNSHHLN